MRVMMLMDMMWHMDDEVRAENKFVFVLSNTPIIHWALKLFIFKKKKNNNISLII